MIQLGIGNAYTGVIVVIESGLIWRQYAAARSNALFHSRHRVNLDNFLGWFCFYHNDLAKRFLLARFCGWLCAHLESCQTRKRKESSLLHLLLGKTRQSADHVGCNFPFQFMLACQCIDQVSLCHGFELGPKCLRELET